MELNEDNLPIETNEEDFQDYEILEPYTEEPSEDLILEELQAIHNSMNEGVLLVIITIIGCFAVKSFLDQVTKW